MQKQTEITTPVNLLNADGTLAINGWARKNNFIYDRNLAKPRWRLKEWDFYQFSNGQYMVQIAFFNISVISSANACIVDLENGKVIAKSVVEEFFTIKKNSPPQRGDVPNYLKYERKGTTVEFDTKERNRIVHYSGKAGGKPFKLEFNMDIMENHENMTIVTPFKNKPTRFFMTTKQNCMPCSGEVILGGEKFIFDKSDSFAVLDWGRGVWPRKNEWYWGNGATYIDGKIFGFEITWKIGDTSNATETCLFYDGKVHKIGVVDVEKFPGDGNKWLENWHITSDDGRFDVIMTPFYDHETGAMLFNALGMKTHQVHGKWNGYAILDDGTKIEIKDMYAFCEYVVNGW